MPRLWKDGPPEGKTRGRKTLAALLVTQFIGACVSQAHRSA